MRALQHQPTHQHIPATLQIQPPAPHRQSTGRLHHHHHRVDAMDQMIPFVFWCWPLLLLHQHLLLNLSSEVKSLSLHTRASPHVRPVSTQGKCALPHRSSINVSFNQMALRAHGGDALGGMFEKLKLWLCTPIVDFIDVWPCEIMLIVNLDAN